MGDAAAVNNSECRSFYLGFSLSSFDSCVQPSHPTGFVMVKLNSKALALALLALLACAADGEPLAAKCLRWVLENRTLLQRVPVVAAAHRGPQSHTQRPLPYWRPYVWLSILSHEALPVSGRFIVFVSPLPFPPLRAAEVRRASRPSRDCGSCSLHAVLWADAQRYLFEVVKGEGLHF
jgi:hypothetical protein